jgi:hypothetical protein
VVGGTVTIDGRISADGVDGEQLAGGGAGGSVFVEASHLAGLGDISATGGKAGVPGAHMSAGWFAGAGAGGRVVLVVGGSATARGSFQGMVYTNGGDMGASMGPDTGATFATPTPTSAPTQQSMEDIMAGIPSGTPVPTPAETTPPLWVPPTDPPTPVPTPQSMEDVLAGMGMGTSPAATPSPTLAPTPQGPTPQSMADIMAGMGGMP